MAAEAHRPTTGLWPAGAPEPGSGPTRLGSQIPVGQPTDPMVIDCDRCTMRGIGCGDCVVTVLLGGPPYGVELDDDERHAIDVLAAAGLVPPLRMVEPVSSRIPEAP
jgi:hypothetical protein